VSIPINRCIAQLGLKNRLLLIQDDHDFITISQIVQLQQKQ